MELAEAIARRRMTRRFEPRSLDGEALDGLLAAALRAPSAGFAQGVELLVLTAEPARRQFWELNSSPEWRSSAVQAPGLLAAPAIVVPVADPGAYLARYGAPDKAGSGLAGLAVQAWPVPYWIVDAAFAVMSLLLAATGAGLGSLFFRLRADPAELLAAYAGPAGGRLIGAVAIGHAAALPDDGAIGDSPGAGRGASRPRRRPFDELVHRDGW